MSIKYGFSHANRIIKGKKQTESSKYSFYSAIDASTGNFVTNHFTKSN